MGQEWFPEEWKGQIPIRYERVEITSAEILDLNSTPKELVPAPGAGKVLEFVSAVFHLKHGGTDYTGGADVIVQNETGTDLSGNLANTFIQSSADAYAILNALQAGVVNVVNEALDLYNSSTTFATGNGTLVVHVAYRIHDFN